MEKKLVAFTKTGAYTGFLEKRANLAASLFKGDSNIKIHLRKEDMRLKDKIEVFFSPYCRFVEASDIHIGGMYIQSNERKLLIDLSLDAMLEEETEYFKNNY